LTDYELLGKHKKLECRTCHSPEFISDKTALNKAGKDLKRTFLGLDSTCTSCHNDEHRGQFTENCTSCHSVEDWKTGDTFDHAKSKFPLTGKHQNVDCAKCHPSIPDTKFANDKNFLKFKGISFKNCSSCHQDVHQGRLGSDCRSCHATSSWQSVANTKFNHNKTSFPLKGLHRQVKCASCHKPGQPLKITCYERCQDCHSDFHRGQFERLPEKGACETCHTVDGFSPARFTISQHAQSRFPLSGAHLALPCLACHQNENGSINKFRFNSFQCITCHKNPHQNGVDKYLILNSQLTQKDGCAHCHQSSSWSSVHFDHNLTTFKLEGRHLEISCISCHEKQEQESTQFTATAKQCNECHQDVHVGQFIVKGGNNTDCSRCHSSTDWLAEKFDHNRDAQFKLTGGHQNVPCSKCHIQVRDENESFVRYKPIDVSCKSCHIQETKKADQ